MRIKFFSALILVAMLSGCASSPRSVTTSIGDNNITTSGKTIEVLALDFNKATSIEYQSLRAVVLQELTDKGMIPVNGAAVEPNYLVLFDYAVDLGTNEPFERRFVAVTFDSKLERIVHRIRLTSEGSTKAPMEIFPQLIKAAYRDYPKSTGIKYQ